jgi:signal transduction histidine kinase/ligand-binding sensor domain-containing protein/DNA-binding response OmpR family regulator
MRYIFILISFLFTAFLLHGNNAPSISLSKVTPEGGVTYSGVTCIGEDELGFIWFGTNNGLYSYNSADIKRYKHSKTDSASISTNRINKIVTDKSGKLWIATEKGLCSYNRKSDDFITYPIKDQFGNFIGNNIYSFFQAADSTYWFSDERGVGTLNLDTNRAFYKNINNKTSRIWLISPDNKGTIWVFFSDGDIYYLPEKSNTFHYFSKGLLNNVRAVLFDDSNIWIAYESEGLLCMNYNGSIKRHYTIEDDEESVLPSNRVRTILRDKHNQIWVGTYRGIAIINDYKVTSVIDSKKQPELPNHSIWSSYRDSQDNIWIGTWLGGVCFHSDFNNSFFHFTHSSPKSSLSDNVVSSFVHIPGEPNILIGTEGGSLNHFNTDKNLFSTIPVTYNGLATRNIKKLTYDKYGTLWVGTYGLGILYREKSSKKFKQLSPPFETGFQVLDICATNTGLWVSSYPMGVYFYDFKLKTFTHYRHNPLDINSISDNNIRQVIQDKKGNMWFATQNGLNLLKEGSNQFIHFFQQENNANSISESYIYGIHEDEDGYLWLATNGQGLDKFDPEKGTTEHYSIKEGLPGNEVFSILQDRDKNLWLTTDRGICMFNPKTKKVKSYYNIKGIQNNRFNPNAAITSTNGELYFGGSNGFIRFRPNEISINPVAPSTIVTQFLINNREVLPAREETILHDIIGKTKSLKLKYDQNSFSFRFVANNYINPEKNSFKYRLVGFSDEWANTNINGGAIFTNVPPGKYTFEVKAANNDGLWNEQPTQIDIRIIAPFWLRWYAYLFYTLFIILNILYFRRQIINKQKLRNEIEMGKIKSETEESLHQMKLQFFTNISHEFRTPLTLIQGPVERMLKSDNDNENSKKQLVLIKNNTQRLLRLINQFLDFRKIESGKMKLNPVNTEIVSFCKNVFNCFEEHARFRSFDFKFESDITELKIDFDPDKIDKVLFNLLSNAFKYSTDGGKITLKLQNNKKSIPNLYGDNFTIGEEIKDDFIEISVYNSGKGIPEENLPKIFDRFFHTENSPKQGTGIGLSLSKNYVLLHNGQLIVKTSEHKGSTFSVYLPQFQPGTLKEEHHSSYSAPVNFSTEKTIPTESTNGQKEKIQNQEALILVAEDNLELLDYLGDLLQEHFRVAKARNGKDALEQTHSLFPDLIISDIMMPEIDGIELCETLKNDIRTSHTPIILLTALDTIKDRISGLNSGADAYIPKPFNDDLLIVQVNNLLESRKSLRESFNTDPDLWEEKYNSFDIDKKLLQRAIKVIETNMTNVEFSVEDMASSLHLSRTHLHRKLKSLTNQSATEFIRYVRLKQAVKLMKEGNYKINEIGYAVGFNSHNYFTKSFKKQYGKSPSEFIRENTGVT